MPTYEYFCTTEKCKELIELRRLIADRGNPVECPKCGAPMRLVMTSPPAKVRAPILRMKGGPFARSSGVSRLASGRG